MKIKPMKSAMRFSAVILSLGWASLAIAGKPQSTAHPVTVTVNAGNSIQSDGNGSYRDSTSGGIEARLWDFVDFSHLHFEVQKKKGRFLRLSIPGVTGGTVSCGVGTLKPNQNANRYNFYDLLPIGASTNDPDPGDPDRSNFGGTFSCDAYLVTYPPCVVIEHTGVGFWRMTAPPLSCNALVTVNGVTLAGTFPVSFQVDVDQLDVP